MFFLGIKPVHTSIVLSEMTLTQQTVGEYLIQALYNHGARHIFGVPGDFVLGFYHMLNQSDKLRLLIHVMSRVQALQQMHTPVLLDLVTCV